MRTGERTRQAGFTLVWVLMALAVFSVAMAVVGPRWADDVRRDRERELLRVGGLYARAIASFHATSPGSAKGYPPTLKSLLADDRMVGDVRHLRRLYADPIEPSRPWGVVTGSDGTVRGVYSQAETAPMSSEPIDLGNVRLPAAQKYSDWKFVPKVPQ